MNIFAEFKNSDLVHAPSNAVEMLSNDVGTLVHVNLSTCIDCTHTNFYLISEI